LWMLRALYALYALYAVRDRLRLGRGRGNRRNT